MKSLNTPGDSGDSQDARSPAPRPRTGGRRKRLTEAQKRDQIHPPVPIRGPIQDARHTENQRMHRGLHQAIADGNFPPADPAAYGIGDGLLDEAADANGPRSSRARRDPYVDYSLGPSHDVGEEWRDTASAQLLDAILALPDRPAAERFFRDLCTIRELDEMAQRWRVVQLLNHRWHYLEISKETGVSTATITRIAQWLFRGTGGYLEALRRGAGVDDAIKPPQERKR